MPWLLALAVASGSLPAMLSSLSPNAAVLLATAGVCLIFVELNRPGRIVPGSLGLLICLLAAATLVQHQLRPGAVLLLFVGLGALALNLWRPIGVAGALVAATCLVVGLRTLVATPLGAHITLGIALTCGLTIGLLGTALSHIAFRARRLKAVH